MKPWELYEKIKDTEYTKSGDDVDWAIDVNDEEKIVYLLFAESNSKRDWINNLTFPAKVYKKQESDLRAAKGWSRAWRSCNDEVMGALKSKYKKGYKVLVTGWSYGGAISLLAAEDWAYRTKQKPDVVTFGSPKPFRGNKSIKYLKRVLGNVKEYGHKDDIVTYLPPFIGYKHVNKVELGKFNPIKLFNPQEYHTIYGDEEWYEGLDV